MPEKPDPPYTRYWDYTGDIFSQYCSPSRAHKIVIIEENVSQAITLEQWRANPVRTII